MSYANTVFVSGLPFDWKKQDIEDRFKDFGVIRGIRAPLWQDSGRLKGYCHIEFSDDTAVNKAVSATFSVTDGKRGSYSLKVENAKKVKQAPRQPICKPGSIPADCRVLFVKNLPYDVSESEIAELFKAIGTIISLRIVTEGRSEKIKGFCYVQFGEDNVVSEILTENRDWIIRGRILFMDTDTEKGMRAGFHYRKAANGGHYAHKSCKPTKHGAKRQTHPKVSKNISRSIK